MWKEERVGSTLLKGNKQSVTDKAQISEVGLPRCLETSSDAQALFACEKEEKGSHFHVTTEWTPIRVFNDI